MVVNLLTIRSLSITFFDYQPITIVSDATKLTPCQLRETEVGVDERVISAGSTVDDMK